MVANGSVHRTVRSFGSVVRRGRHNETEEFQRRCEEKRVARPVWLHASWCSRGFPPFEISTLVDPELPRVRGNIRRRCCKHAAGHFNKRREMEIGFILKTRTYE